MKLKKKTVRAELNLSAFTFSGTKTNVILVFFDNRLIYEKCFIGPIPVFRKETRVSKLTEEVS